MRYGYVFTVGRFARPVRTASIQGAVSIWCRAKMGKIRVSVEGQLYNMKIRAGLRELRDTDPLVYRMRRESRERKYGKLYRRQIKEAARSSPEMDARLMYWERWQGYIINTPA